MTRLRTILAYIVQTVAVALFLASIASPFLILAAMQPAPPPAMWSSGQ